MKLVIGFRNGERIRVDVPDDIGKAFLEEAPPMLGTQRAAQIAEARVVIDMESVIYIADAATMRL